MSNITVPHRVRCDRPQPCKPLWAVRVAKAHCLPFPVGNSHPRVPSGCVLPCFTLFGLRTLPRTDQRFRNSSRQAFRDGFLSTASAGVLTDQELVAILSRVAGVAMSAEQQAEDEVRAVFMTQGGWLVGTTNYLTISKLRTARSRLYRR